MARFGRIEGQTEMVGDLPVLDELAKDQTRQHQDSEIRTVLHKTSVGQSHLRHCIRYFH